MVSNATDPTTTMLIVSYVLLPWRVKETSKLLFGPGLQILSQAQLQFLPRCCRNCFGIGEYGMRKCGPALARSHAGHCRHCLLHHPASILRILQQHSHDLIDGDGIMMRMPAVI